MSMERYRVHNNAPPAVKYPGVTHLSGMSNGCVEEPNEFALLTDYSFRMMDFMLVVNIFTCSYPRLRNQALLQKSQKVSCKERGPGGTLGCLSGSEA